MTTISIVVQVSTEQLLRAVEVSSEIRTYPRTAFDKVWSKMRGSVSGGMPLMRSSGDSPLISSQVSIVPLLVAASVVRYSLAQLVVAP